MQSIKLSELIGALSHALDMTEGQPKGHCERCTYIGMRVAQYLNLDSQTTWELYYTILLKDLGCSSNAARICELYTTDDLTFKRDFKLVGTSFPQIVRFVLTHTGLQSSLAERFRKNLEIFQNGEAIAHDLIQTRCQRGADIARRLRFSENVALGIFSLDEHWDGSGKPDGLSGHDIPLYSQIALLAQIVDVFHTAGGPQDVLKELRQRQETWFDSRLVQAIMVLGQDPEFWAQLKAPTLSHLVRHMEPAQHSVPLTDEYLDEIVEAFGQIIDAKSPYTAGHSTRVGLYTDLIGERLGIEPERRRWLRRAALLHDIGKLGVSNTILDKPGSLTEDEWKAVRSHAVFTESLLMDMSFFADMAPIAGAHHEKLDGTGYPKQLRGEDILMDTRIITTADIFDALSAERPYRGAIPTHKCLEIMEKISGSALDPQCLVALADSIRSLESNIL